MKAIILLLVLALALFVRLDLTPNRLDHFMIALLLRLELLPKKRHDPSIPHTPKRARSTEADGSSTRGQISSLLWMLLQLGEIACVHHPNFEIGRAHV